MLSKISNDRPEWEIAIMNHPELDLFWDSKFECYVVKFRYAAYYADFIQLQYLANMMPFQDSEISVAMWAYRNQLIPFIQKD